MVSTTDEALTVFCFFGEVGASSASYLRLVGMVRRAAFFFLPSPAGVGEVLAAGSGLEAGVVAAVDDERDDRGVKMAVVLRVVSLLANDSSPEMDAVLLEGDGLSPPALT